MKRIWDEIKANIRKNRTELLLMLLFLCAAVILNGPQIVQETISGAVLSSAEEKAESEDGSQAETGDSAENEENSGRGTEKSEAPAAFAETEKAGENEKSGEGRDDSSREGYDTSYGGDDAGGTSDTFGEEDEETGETPEVFDTENESSYVLVEISETEAAYEDLTMTVVSAAPEASSAESGGSPVAWGYRDIRDWRQLHGFTLRTLQEAEQTAAFPENWDWRLLWEKQSEKPISLLETMMENRIAGYDGEWSVYVKNLNTNESFTVNDHSMKSASVMKLFIMGTVYKSFENGSLERTEEVMNLIRNMIVYSDNEASNQLLYLLGDSSYEAGIERVNEFISAYKFSDMTVEYNGFNNPATNTDSDSMNQVSARDCGRLLEDIYRRTWVSREVSNEMESFLLSQDTRYKIPAGLPDGVLCGNKTGEMDTTENDAAIIYSDACDYILVVLSSDWSSKDDAILGIRSISEMVYEFWN